MVNTSAIFQPVAYHQLLSGQLQWEISSFLGSKICCSIAKLCLFTTPWTAAHQVSLSFTISQSLLKLTSIESVMPSNHHILSHPILLLSIFPSIRVFSSELALRIRWPKYWSFHFSISSFNEYSELISFRIDCFDLLAVQGTLKSLLQHHSSKASILQHIADYNSRENKGIVNVHYGQRGGAIKSD